MVQSISVSQVPIARRVALISQLRAALKHDPKNAQLHLDLAGLLIGEKNVEDNRAAAKIGFMICHS